MRSIFLPVEVEERLSLGNFKEKYIRSRMIQIPTLGKDRTRWSLHVVSWPSYVVGALLSVTVERGYEMIHQSGWKDTG